MHASLFMFALALSASGAPLSQKHFHTKRIAQTISESTQKWEAACLAAKGGEKCNPLSVTAFSTLLAGAGPCEQQDAADKMIDLAKSLDNDKEMIRLTQIFVQQTRNTPTGLSTPYCQKEPKSTELKGLYQCQFEGARPEFIGGAESKPFGKIEVSPAGSCPAHPDGPIPDGAQLVELVGEGSKKVPEEPVDEPTDEEEPTEEPAEEPTEEEPVDEEPVEEEPVEEEPVEEEPVEEEPVEEEPVEEEPVEKEPTDEEPADEPTDEEPAEEPIEAPADEPTDEEPAEEEETTDEPAEEKSADEPAAPATVTVTVTVDKAGPTPPVEKPSNSQANGAPSSKKLPSANSADAPDSASESEPESESTSTSASAKPTSTSAFTPAPASNGPPVAPPACAAKGKRSLSVSMSIAKRIAQADLPAVAQSWQDLCLVSGGDITTGDPCVKLAGLDGINGLLAGTPPCFQQDNADAMIDFAKSPGIKNKDALIANAIAYREHPRNALDVGGGVVPSTLYCDKAPKNKELIGKVNRQLDGVNPGLFGGPKNPVVAFGAPGTCPFGEEPNVETCTCE